MNFLRLFKFVLVNQYFSFSGRIGKNEYWKFTIVHLLILMALQLPLVFVEKVDFIQISTDLKFNLEFIPAIYFLFTLIPWLGLSCRRLHDTGRTGWLLALSFIPILGALIAIGLLIILAEKGNSTSNAYGEVPTNLSYLEIDKSLIA